MPMVVTANDPNYPIYDLETEDIIIACVDEETMVSVTVTEVGEPASGITVDLWSVELGSLGSAVTDRDGVASFTLVPAEADTFSLEFSANNGGDVTFVTNSELVVSRCNTPPDCATAVPSKFILWPPNHKFHDITIKSVTDVDGDSVNIIITSIYCDEETATASGVGGTTHAPDASGVGTNTARLRAERSGAEPRNGRVYTIGFAATDGSGGACNGAVEVGVPHAKKDTPINDGALYDATI
jgi:hypothetical protein